MKHRTKRVALRHRYGRSSGTSGGRLYVGRTAAGSEVFRSTRTPTEASHGHRFRYVTGPFRTRKGAQFMADFGENNPHCQTVAQAEKIAAGKTYDVALGRWV